MNFFSRIGSDFWPPDQASIGSNIMASVICLVGGYFVGFRRAWRKLHDKLDLHHKETMAAHHKTHEYTADSQGSQGS